MTVEYRERIGQPLSATDLYEVGYRFTNKLGDQFEWNADLFTVKFAHGTAFIHPVSDWENYEPEPVAALSPSAWTRYDRVDYTV